jgi:hypothetical protein
MAQQITFDWRTGEDEYLHEVTQHFDLNTLDDPHFTDPFDNEAPYALPFDRSWAESPVRDGERALALFALRAVAALLFVIMAAGSAPMSPDQVVRQEIERELNVVLEMDANVWRTRDREAYAALIDPSVGRAWPLEWREGWGAKGSGRTYATSLGTTQLLEEGLVQAEVHVSAPRSNWWEAEELRETRFYRDANEMWLRTLPPDDYWGERMTLNTDLFVFDYYARDAESVEAAAAQIDDVYTELLQAVGLDSPPDGRPVEVRVRSRLSRTRGSTDGTVDVLSPILSQVPADISDADYLANRVFSRVTSEALRAASSHASSHRWAFFFSVMRNWLVEDLLGQPTHWLVEADDVFRADMADARSLRLSDLDTYYVGGTPGRETVLWRYAAAGSLLDYIVAQEGEDVLPELVRGLSQVRSWPLLIESVFGVSETEFEAGWNDYLASEYGFQPAAEWAAR